MNRLNISIGDQGFVHARCIEVSFRAGDDAARGLQTVMSDFKHLAGIDLAGIRSREDRSLIEAVAIALHQNRFGPILDLKNQRRFIRSTPIIAATIHFRILRTKDTDPERLGIIGRVDDIIARFELRHGQPVIVSGVHHVAVMRRRGVDRSFRIINRRVVDVECVDEIVHPADVIDMLMSADEVFDAAAESEGVQFVNQRRGITIGDIHDHLRVVWQFDEETISAPFADGDHVYLQEARGRLTLSCADEQACRCGE